MPGLIPSSGIFSHAEGFRDKDTAVLAYLLPSTPDKAPLGLLHSAVMIPLAVLLGAPPRPCWSMQALGPSGASTHRKVQRR